MKIKLTVERGRGHPPADIFVSAEGETTVGALAEHIVRSDPDCSWDLDAEYTLSFAGSTARAIRPESGVTEVDLRSGAVVSLIPRDREPLAQSSRPAAVLLVVGGPDAGKEFPLGMGTSVIGRGRDCEVRLSDPMTSRRHAKVHIGESVEITDLGSVNGVLVGDAPADTAILGPGDRAVLGDTVIAVRLDLRDQVTPNPAGGVTFNRPPRIQPRYEGRHFTLPDVPTLQRGQRFPIIPLFAPLLMGSALYLTTRSVTSLIFMAMSPLMMLGNVMEGQLAGKRNYQRAMDKFRESVGHRHDEVGVAAVHEADVRRAEYPSLAECQEAIRTRSPLLWSRRPQGPAFGHVRLGLGRQTSRSKVEFPLARQIDPDIPRDLHERFDGFSMVDDVPVIADLEAGGPLGVAGAAPHARSVARNYVVQLASIHSPAELSICSVCSSERTAEWEWLKWLPHCETTSSPLECDPLGTASGSGVLIGELEALVRARAEGGKSDAGSWPRVLVLVDGPWEAERSRLVDVAERGTGCGVWVVWVADRTIDLPACCKVFVDVPSGPENAEASFVDVSQHVAPLRVEPLALVTADDVARRMSPIVDASAREDTQSDVPRSVSLLTLVGGDLATEPARVIERWVENRSVLTGPHAPQEHVRARPGNLRALIGESAAGPYVLDLRTNGPHALVGGTTGSGKSEMLQSWIVAMALSNSPQRLTFLLVDYKGGSAFSECVHLPHTVGLVTDLSPHLVRRALTSLSAELRYREHILHRKRAKDLASLEREGDPDAPPSLVIVVDEFAALVKEVPEFVDGVVNVAQRGRSLGLHLILATQRPSGVIRDNLRANTNLRIALRMADAADSTDVIGTKAAASFDPTIPGRAASRTGPTALVPFQTGYVGGWTTSEPRPPDIVISTFGFAPRATWLRPVDETSSEPAEGPTDIQRLVSCIGGASAQAKIAEPRKPWLAELAPLYNLAKLPSRRRDDELVFAVADDPARQQQPTVAFRPDDHGNMAVFGTGNSGKSTLLRTLSLAAGYTVRGGPCHVYGVDFGARGLQMLEQLPHVGSIISGNDVERVSRLFSSLRELIDERAVSFADVGAGSITQYREISGRADEPRILLLIDGMGGMRTAFEGTEHHRLFESFLAIARDGRQVGVHVIIAADRAGAVPSSLASLIQHRVVLRLAGENDYAMLGQPTDVLDQKSPPGRGLYDGLEIQVAILGDSPDLLSQDIAVSELAAAMRKAEVRPAEPVRRLDEEIPLDGLDAEVDGCPTFAIAGDTLEPKGIPTQGTFTVAGPPGSGRTTTLLTIATAFRRWNPASRLVYVGSKRSVLATAIEWTRSALDPSEAAELAPVAVDLLGEAGDGTPPGLVLIEDLAGFLQTEADAPLQELIKAVMANGHLVVADGEPVPLSGLQPLVQSARSSRVGLVLQPEQSDSVLFRVQFPRLRKSDFPPGRGMYVGRGQLPVTVQVAYTGTSPH